MAISGLVRALPAAALAAAFILSPGCAPVSPRTDHPAPVRWILVERPAGQMIGPDSGVSGDAPLLVLEPVPLEGPVLSSGLALEILELEPPGPAEPGETVRVRLRVARAEPGAVYWLRARPSAPGVRILGPRERFVRGDEMAVFRFTSLSIGQAGISVNTRSRVERFPALSPGPGIFGARIPGP